jgi:hypothetical protein
MSKFKILISITGETAKNCLSQIKELQKYQVPEAALFLERLIPADRELVYEALAKFKLKIPLIHLRHDMTGREVLMLFEKYQTEYFTIHEDHFNIIKNWRGFYKKLYLEMTTDNYVAKNVKVEKIGGFCVDLAHYKKQAVLNNKDFKYVYKRRHQAKIFACNHISGYDYLKNTDVYLKEHKKDFSYLKDLPNFVFGKVLAIEVDDSIKKQLIYKDRILKILDNATRTK